MNWGTKLIIGMTLFMTFIVALGILMFRSNTDALVDNDYYEKGIHYNDEYDSKERVKTDLAKPLLEINGDELRLTFTSSAIGNLKLMRLDDKKLDRNIKFESNEDHQVSIPTGLLTRGRWNLIVHWTSGGRDYIYEQEIHLK